MWIDAGKSLDARHASLDAYDIVALQDAFDSVDKGGFVE